MSGDSPRIPFLDLERSTRELGPLIEPAIIAALRSGRVLDGPRLRAFEQAWAESCGAPQAVAVGSGTDALALSLTALGVGYGDEVILPALTAVPTIAAVCATGGTPVPVDVDEAAGVLDVAAAERAVTPRTRAVITVDLYGHPSPIPHLGVPVIEDAAHAHGATARPEAACTAYSFYPTKNLGAVGDGGAVATADATLAAEIQLLRAHGRDAAGEHVRIAGNSRMSEPAAAGLLVTLPLLGHRNDRRRAIAAAYRDAAPHLRWQAAHDQHTRHLCVVRVPDREAFRGSLPCGTGIHYPRALTDEPAYREFERDPVPEARAWAAECVSLPCYPELTDAELEEICGALARTTADSPVGTSVL